MVVLNLDNSETRRIVENCYRTQKTLINPLIDWDDDFLYWYIRKENIELNPLYGCGWGRVGCIGCPLLVNIGGENLKDTQNIEMRIFVRLKK